MKSKITIYLATFILFYLTNLQNAVAFTTVKSSVGHIAATVVDNKISVNNNDHHDIEKTNVRKRKNIVIYDLKKDYFTFDQKPSDKFKRITAYKSLFLPNTILDLSYGVGDSKIGEYNNIDLIVKLKNHKGEVLNLLLKPGNQIHFDKNGQGTINVDSKLNLSGPSKLDGVFEGTYHVIILY